MLDANWVAHLYIKRKRPLRGIKVPELQNICIVICIFIINSLYFYNKILKCEFKSLEHFNFETRLENFIIQR